MSESPDLFAGINRPKDPENLTDLEKKHTPVVSAPDQVRTGECFEVTVTVGKLFKHPADRDHFIRSIDLYAGEVCLARLDLAAVRTCPVLKACVRLDRHLGPLRAIETCNIHGAWESVRPIQVV